MEKYKTVDELKAKLVEVHGLKYDYSKVTLDTIIKIVCPEHGEWTAARRDVIRGKGCKKCYYANKPKISTERLVSRFRERNGAINTIIRQLISKHGVSLLQ